MRGFTAMALAVTVLVSTGARVCLAQDFIVDETTKVDFGNLDQSEVGPTLLNGVNNFCVPTATINSFMWLQAAYPKVYTNNMLMGGQSEWRLAAQLLASTNYMSTDTNNGTTLNNQIIGTTDYLYKFAPGTTTVTWTSNPTANWLLHELQDGEDVELCITNPGNSKEHVLTLTGINWNDANSNGVFDAGDTLTLNSVDPIDPDLNTPLTLNTNSLITNNNGEFDYQNWQLEDALAESPVPEPATFSLALLGGAAIAFFRNRRTGRRW